MDDSPQFEPEFSAEPSLDNHEPLPDRYTGTFFSKSKDFGLSGGNFTNVIEAAPSHPPGGARDQNTSAFFPNSKDFVVTGGTFTNINQVTPSTPSDFRVIPIGDLNLLKEIKHASGSLVVRRRKGQASTKKMYTARIPGFQSAMTAAVFQGQGAEEQWRAEISRYADIRHPNLLQLYGIASARGLHAAVYHDDLIPHGDIPEKYRGAHFSTVFFWACIDAQFYDVDQYMFSMSGRNLDWTEYMVWIRPSTTQLCIELMAPAHDYLELSPLESGIRPSDISFSQWETFPISTNDSVQLGSIRHFPGLEYKSLFEIAFAPDFVTHDGGWETEDHIVDQLWHRLNGVKEGTSIHDNGWIRVNSANVVDKYRRRVYANDISLLAWLAQANHIFNTLVIRSSFDKYVYVDCIECQLLLKGPIDTLPPGYLFLCPLTDIQTELLGHFQIPACAAYWSHDSSGMERLSAEEARNEGFPDIELRMQAAGRTREDDVYTGVRQLHQAKGFDPCSQELAIELGCPLFQASCEWNDLFKHLQESGTEDDYDSDGYNDFSHSEDEQSNAEPDALQDTALAADTEINTYEHEDVLSNLHQMDGQYAVTPSQTISLGQTTTGCPLASIQLTDNRHKRAHPAAFQSDRQPASSKRSRFLPPGPLRSEAPNFGEDSSASFASSSRVTLDNLRSSSNTLRSASPLGELDHLVDPLH
ncbi:hypothetical protein B0H19DRAFT_1272783 [Mycena capillaripes]|nr:hypothetical protein B0H19DRAFT_1272783 [Mycena capillaripes]